MTTQPEALRLADLIRSRHGNDINDEAAAELRRLSAVEAQRDALLEALKLARPYISVRTMAGYHAEVKADAAIRAVEKTK